MQLLRLTLLLAASAFAAAQSPPPSLWQMQESGATAGLRGIDSVDDTVAWASGTNGTVLKTIDGGAHWTQCAIPDADKDGATLDLRGVQAWDAKTAIVMASGKGSLSRLYKTTDGCFHWKILLYNPEKEGFWDTLYFPPRDDGKGIGNGGWLLGDPVGGRFWLLHSYDRGDHWTKQIGKGMEAEASQQGIFAASNSNVINHLYWPFFITGGKAGTQINSIESSRICLDACTPKESNFDGKWDKWKQIALPIENGTESWVPSPLMQSQTIPTASSTTPL